MEKPNVGYPFYVVFPSDRIPRQRRVSVYITLFTVANPVNSTNKSREGFQSTVYNFIEWLHVSNFLCLLITQLIIWRVILKYFRGVLSVCKSNGSFNALFVTYDTFFLKDEVKNEARVSVVIYISLIEMF